MKKRNTLLTVGMASLLLMVLVLPVAAQETPDAQPGPRGPRMGPPPGGAEGGHIARLLEAGVSDQQIRQMAEKRNEHQEATLDLRLEGARLHQELRELGEDAYDNRKTIEQKQTRLGEIRAEMDRLRIEHHHEMEQMLTDEQQEALKQFDQGRGRGPCGEGLGPRGPRGAKRGHGEGWAPRDDRPGRGYGYGWARPHRPSYGF